MISWHIPSDVVNFRWFSLIVGSAGNLDLDRENLRERSCSRGEIQRGIQRGLDRGLERVGGEREDKSGLNEASLHGGRNPSGGTMATRLNAMRFKYRLGHWFKWSFVRSAGDRMGESDDTKTPSLDCTLIHLLLLSFPVVYSTLGHKRVRRLSRKCTLRERVSTFIVENIFSPSRSLVA